MGHRTTDELEDGLDEVRSAPADNGVVELIARRTAIGQREVLDTGELTPDDGLVGDGWYIRDKSNPGRQLTVMNARAIALIAGERDRWALAGDQLYVDFDISEDNLPAGTRLSLGTAVIEISEAPHTGCAKFAERFGMDAARFVNSPEGTKLRVRGLNARVVQGGIVAVGDAVRKDPAAALRR
jgi:MOSC domain-containing protein YiiM